MAIYAEMPNGVRLEFPDGTTPEVMQNAAQSYLSQQGMSGQLVAPGLTNQPKQGEMEWTDVASSAAKNFIPSAKRAVEDIGHMVMHPVDTAESLGNLAMGAGQKAWRAMTGGTEKGDKEQYADAVADYFAQRYGSLEGFKKAIALDPVGVLSDASTVFTAGAGAAKGLGALSRAAGKAGAIGGAVPNRAFLEIAKAAKKGSDIMGKVGELTDPLMLAAKGARKGTQLAIGDQWTLPQKLYQSALSLNTGFSNGSKARFSPYEVWDVTKQGLETGTPVTMGGYKATEGRVRGLSRTVEDAIDATDAAGVRLDPEAIAKKALEGDYRTMAENFNNPVGPTRSYDAAIGEYLDTHGVSSTLRREHEGKKGTYRKYEGQYRNNASPVANARAEAEMELAHQQRNAIGDAHAQAVEAGLVPELPGGRSLHDVNAELGTTMELRDAIGRSLLKAGNKPMVDYLTGGVMGAALGDLGAGMFLGGGKQWLTSPGVRSRAAIGLDRAGKFLDWAGPGIHDAMATAYGVGRGSRVEEGRRGKRGGLLKRFER